MGTYYIGDPIPIDGLQKGDTLFCQFTSDTGTHTKTIKVNMDPANFKFIPTLSEYAPWLQTTRKGTLLLVINPGQSSTSVSYTHTLRLPSDVIPSIVSYSISYENTFNNKVIKNVSSGNVNLTIKGVYGVKQYCMITSVSSSKMFNMMEIDAIPLRNETNITVPIGVIVQNESIEVKIQDTRGMYCSITLSINGIQEYTPVQVSVSAEWNADFKPVVTSKITKQDTVAGATNDLTLARLVYDSEDCDGQIFELPSAEYTGVLPGNFDSTKSYDIRIEAADSVQPDNKATSVFGFSPFSPTVDFGADGNTVSLFGPAPASASKRSLRVGDYATIWEDEIELGATNKIVVNGDGVIIKKNTEEQLRFGNSNIVIVNTLGDATYSGEGAAIESSTKNLVVSTTQTSDTLDTTKGGKAALELYYNSDSDIVGLSLGVKKGMTHSDLYESEGRGVFMEYGNYDDGDGNVSPSADISVIGDNISIIGGNTFVSGDYVRLSSTGSVHCESADGDFVLGKNKILWQHSGYYMGANQTIYLNEPISKQQSGVVFVWSHYDNSKSAADNWGWQYHFVPKFHIVNWFGCGIHMGANGTQMLKYLYVFDDHVNGNSANTNTLTSNGVQLANKNYVLRYVIGV